jgi:hypothetical protein
VRRGGGAVEPEGRDVRDLVAEHLGEALRVAVPQVGAEGDAPGGRAAAAERLAES